MTRKIKKRLSFNRRMRACYNAIKICLREKHLYQASALTYSSLLAVVPIIAISIYLAALMPFFDVMVESLKRYAMNNFMPEISENANVYLNQFVHHAAKLPLGGIIFLFFTVGMLLHLIRSTMNDIWHSDNTYTWLAVLISWTAMLLMPLLVGLSIFSSYYFLSLSWVTYTMHHYGMTFLLTSIAPVFINTIAFSLLYYFAPNCYVRISDALFGALTASVLFEIAKRIFEYYTKHFATYDFIYGSLATIPLFMIWIYICWSIIIYGAIVTYAQNQQRIV